MVEDKREAILVALLAVGKALFKNENAVRNEIDLPERRRPAFILLDGDESADEGGFGRNRPANGPIIMRMTPEVFILLGAKSPDVGSALNVWRAKVIKAVTNDPTLVSLTYQGDIRYEGMATGLASGRTIEGEAGLSFSLAYVLRPNAL